MRTQLYRVPLFDRIFKPEIITLPNGKQVPWPRSRMPLILLILLIVVWGSVKLTGFDLGIIIRRGNQFTVILAQIFQPDFSYFSKVPGPLLDTIKMSILGSVLGATLALPFSVVASSNINRRGWSVAVLRFLLNIVRTLPTLINSSRWSMVGAYLCGMVILMLFIELFSTKIRNRLTRG